MWANRWVVCWHCCHWWNFCFCISVGMSTLNFQLGTKGALSLKSCSGWIMHYINTQKSLLRMCECVQCLSHNVSSFSPVGNRQWVFPLDGWLSIMARFMSANDCSVEEENPQRWNISPMKVWRNTFHKYKWIWKQRKENLFPQTWSEMLKSSPAQPLNWVIYPSSFWFSKLGNILRAKAFGFTPVYQ